MQNHPLSTLILCNDPEAVNAANAAFSERGITAQVAPGSSSVIGALEKMKCDALVLDLDEAGAWDVLQHQSRNSEHQPGIVIALAGDPQLLAEAQKLRIHFVLRKPFTSHLMARTLGAAHHLLLKEKHIPFRKSVRIPVSGSHISQAEEHKIESATILDISIGGLCMQLLAPLPADAIVILDFRLPDTNETMHIAGKVMWTEARGKAGIKFHSVPPAEAEKLRRWLGARCPRALEMPPPAAAQAQAAR